MTDLGSRIKNRQKSLVGATNHPVGVGNASLIGWFIFYFKRQKTTCSLVVPLLFVMEIKLVQIYCSCLDGQPINFPLKKGARFWLPPLSSALVYPCEQSIFFTNHFPDLREDKCQNSNPILIKQNYWIMRENTCFFLFNLGDAFCVIVHQTKVS